MNRGNQIRAVGTIKQLPGNISILYEDDEILVVVKPTGLLTMGTDREKSRTLYSILTDYVRKGYSRSAKRVFIVHRLDRDTSGILVFAKSVEAKLKLQGQWETTEKRYLTVVHGRLEQKEGIVKSYLTENKAQLVYSTPDASRGKFSRTAYSVLKETRNFSLLEIILLTGRKHQIRVHLADIGHPVLGDLKYGKRETQYKRLALHARSISFMHPITGRKLVFETPAPDYFDRFFIRKPVTSIRTGKRS